MAIYAHSFLIPQDPDLRAAVTALAGPVPIKICPSGDVVMTEQGSQWTPLPKGTTPRECLDQVRLADQIDQLVRAHFFQHHAEEAQNQNFSTEEVMSYFRGARIRSLEASCRLYEVWNEPKPFFEKVWITFIASLEQLWYSFAAFLLSSTP